MVTVRIALTIAHATEDGVGLLFEKPLEEALVAFVGLDGFDGIVGVAELVVGEGAVDEAFAGLAGGDDDAAALGFGDYVVAAGGDVAVAEDAHV